MRKIYTVLCLTSIALLSSTISSAQLVGGNAYMKGDYVEVAICNKGNEGAAAIPDDTEYHFRGGAPSVPWGFCSNPAMDGWVIYNGDFFTPGTPECGIGITYTMGGVTYNKGNNYDIFQIPGEITGYTETADSIIVTWLGMVDSLEIGLMYELEKSELKYTTTVTLNNIGSNTFTDVYYYDNLDPDNNQSVGGSYVTTNELISQSEMADDSVIIRASQATPWMSEVYYEAYGADWKGAIGGFSNRSGYEIWNGTAGKTITEGYINTGDEAIALAHKTETIAPGRSSAVEFSYGTTFAGSALGNSEGGVSDVGIDKMELVDFRLYPNPAQGEQITIQLEGNFNYIISDASGRVVLSNAGNDIETINIKSLEKGIYFVQVEQNGNTSTERFIVR